MNSFSQLQPVPSGVIHWNDLPVKKDHQRESRKLLEGTTHEFSYFEIHATTMETTISSKTAVLGAGSVLLIPPLTSQSFRNIGDGPLTYYVLMFRSNKGMNMERSDSAGGAMLLNYDSLAYTEKGSKGTRKYFDRPTAMCDNYEMHITYLKEKGPSHAPHQHVDTEIILVINGETEMDIDGQHYTGGPGDLYIVESGKLHGVGNATEKPCSYFAFKWR
jgi:mannose-6-phosphate isomerase-like protein (cupin superfamily)